MLKKSDVKILTVFLQVKPEFIGPFLFRKARNVFASLTANGCVQFSADSCQCNFTELQVSKTVFLVDYDSCMILIRRLEL